MPGIDIQYFQRGICIAVGPLLLYPMDNGRRSHPSSNSTEGGGGVKYAVTIKYNSNQSLDNFLLTHGLHVVTFQITLCPDLWS